MMWLDGIINSMDMILSTHWVIVKDREAGQAAVHGFAKSQARQSKWTTTDQLDARLDMQKTGKLEEITKKYVCGLWSQETYNLAKKRRSTFKKQFMNNKRQNCI